jgi:hypothetical protein
MAPDPAKRSRTEAPMVFWPKIEKMASLTGAAVGLIRGSLGITRCKPLKRPVIIFSIVFSVIF